MHYWVLTWAIGCVLTFWFLAVVHRKVGEPVTAADVPMLGLMSGAWFVFWPFVGACWLGDYMGSKR